MLTITITKNYKEIVEKEDRYVLPFIDVEANLIITLDRPLFVNGFIDTNGGFIDTNGGFIDTNGGNIYTHGGFIYTNGGSIDTHGGSIDTHGGSIESGFIDTNGGYIDTHGGYIDTHGGSLKCEILYWRLMCMPKVAEMTIGKVRPDALMREYWQTRLGIMLVGCWNDIEKQLAPHLDKIPELLKDPKWTPTERWIMESWLPKVNSVAV